MINKFRGKVGFAIVEEEEPGIYSPTTIKEREYTGETVKWVSKWQIGDGINDNQSLENQISIIADPFAFEHFTNIVYIEFMKSKWKVNSVEIQYPRLVLSVGGVYNGQQPDE